MNGAVGDRCQLLIVGNNDKGLSELIAQIEEQLMQFLLVL